MAHQIGDVVKFGKHDERIGVVVGIEDAGDGVVLIVKTPQNVIYRQTYDYCTPDMEPRPASVEELVAVASAMRDGIVNRMDEYLAPYTRQSGARVVRIVSVAALAALPSMLTLTITAKAMGEPLLSDVALLAAAASLVILALTLVVERENARH